MTKKEEREEGVGRKHNNSK